METWKLTMCHGIWVQQTPLMAYVMQGITVFLVAWMRGWSFMCLKHSGGMDFVASAAYIGA